MDSNEPGVTPKFYNLTDAARVIGVKPELVLRAPLASGPTTTLEPMDNRGLGPNR